MFGCGIKYHCFPKYDQILSVWINSKDTDVLPEWQGDNHNYYCITAVSDIEVREFFAGVRERRDFLISMLRKRLLDTNSWEISIKPIFRFSDVDTANKFNSLFDNMNSQSVHELVEDLRLNVIGEKPWIFTPSISDFHIDDRGIAFEYGYTRNSENLQTL